MKYIGAHVSASGGVENAPINADKIGATAFALFVKNQRQWSGTPISKKSVEAFKKNCEKFGYSIDTILPHDGYLINLGHPEEPAREKSLDAFIDEIRRCELLGLKYLNFHPGSHLKAVSEEKCLNNIAASINHAQSETESLILLIENTAGQGTNVGYKFEHLAYIISKVNDKSRIGVCFDTCHGLASGYNIIDEYDQVFDEMERIIGLKFLRGMHVNDSKKGLASHVDRHLNLGKGEIPVAFFKRLMQDKRFDNIPLILETPEEELWPQEIKLLKEFAGI